MAKIFQSNHKPDFKSKVVIELLNTEISIRELGLKYKISSELINLWKIEILDTVSKLFIQEKRKIIDSYINWTKTKLTGFDPMHLARQCVEHIAIAKIVDCLKITEFNTDDFDRFQDQGVFTRQYHRKFVLRTYIDIVEYFKLLPDNVIDNIEKIRLKGNISVHDDPAYTSEIEDFHIKLTSVVDDFFKAYNESNWEGKYVKPQIESLFYDMAMGITIQNKKLGKIEIEDKVEDAKNQYFKYLENESRKILFEFIPSKRKTQSVIEIMENSFVPLSLIELENYYPILMDFGMHGRYYNYSRFNIRTNIDEALLKKKHLAVFSNPGGGKSTLLISFALSCAFPELGKQVFNTKINEPRFPIFIRCREFEKKITNPIIEIIKSIPDRAEIPNIRKQFEYLVLKALEDGSAFLLIDGLDEIKSDGIRKQFTEQLKTFFEVYPNIGFIITSREHGIREAQWSLSLSGYCSYYVIAPLKSSEIEQLTINWYKIVIEDPLKSLKEAKKAIERISNDKEIRVLAENPLLLNALLLVNSKDGYLPRNKNVLYEKATKILLKSWNIEGHEQDQLDYEETELQLAYVAYMMTKYYQQIIHENDLIQYLKRAQLQINRRLDYTISDFIRKVEARSGLLRKSGNASYEFVHLSFQDYFAAIAVVKKYLPKVDYDIKPIDLIKKDHWEDVLLFMVPLLSKESFDELIKYIISFCKSLTQKDYDLWKANLGIFNDNLSAFASYNYKFKVVFLLGKFIERELEFDELLDDVLEWYAKCYNWVSEADNEPNILESKYSDAFEKKVKCCFFNQYDNGNAFGLIHSLTYVSTSRSDILFEQDLSSFFNFIKRDIRDPNKEIKCMGVLRLQHDYTRFSLSEEVFDNNGRNKIHHEIWDIFHELSETSSFDDPHYYSIIAKTIGTLGENYPKLIDNIKYIDYINLFLNGWMNNTESSLQYISAFALYGILDPNMKLEASIEFKEIINQKIQYPLHNLDKIIAIYSGIMLGIDLDHNEVLKTLKNSEFSLKSLMFASEIGLNILD